jgi:hypothetical protein
MKKKRDIKVTVEENGTKKVYTIETTANGVIVDDTVETHVYDSLAEAGAEILTEV